MVREREVLRIPLGFRTGQMAVLILGKDNGKRPLWQRETSRGESKV